MTSPLPPELMENALLAKLKDEDRQRLVPHMIHTDLPAQAILQRAGEDVMHTWFPCGAATAAFRVAIDDANRPVEVALVGSEGAVGGIISNGHVPAFATCHVQAGGKFLRIKTAALEQCKLDSLALRHWFSRYADCLLAQTFQTTACNATHTIVQRTAKWLLASLARTGGVKLEITQEQLAERLGVGRTYVARVVGQLRDERVIETRRGVFIIRDESALRRKTCGCTAAIENHFDNVLHGIYPAL
jgi:hypothetical protein